MGKPRIKPNYRRRVSEVLKCAGGNSMRAKRDYAMLALLFGCGFRRSELVGLELDEVRPSRSRSSDRILRNQSGNFP